MGSLGLFLSVAVGIFGLIGAIYWYRASRASQRNRIAATFTGIASILGIATAFVSFFAEPAKPTIQNAGNKNSPNISSGGGSVTIGHIGDVINPPATSPAIDLSKYEGVLVPSNLPTPRLPCIARPPADALVVLWGSSASWNQSFPITILRMAGDPMIVVDKDKDQNLIVSLLRVFDDRNDSVAHIDEDGFWVQNSVRKKRPDQSTLVVFDHNDTEVLRIHYLNPHAVSVEGIFRHPKISPIFWKIDGNQAVQMPYSNFYGGECLANVPVSIDVGLNGSIAMGLAR